MHEDTTVSLESSFSGRIQLSCARRGAANHSADCESGVAGLCGVECGRAVTRGSSGRLPALAKTVDEYRAGQDAGSPDAEVGYGVNAPGGLGLATPYGGVWTSESGERA